jgi:hypothetical protein
MVPIKDWKQFDRTFGLVLDPILHISRSLVCDLKNKFLFKFSSKMDFVPYQHIAQN